MTKRRYQAGRDTVPSLLKGIPAYRLQIKPEAPDTETGGRRGTKKDLQARFNRLIGELRSSRGHFRNVVEKNADGIILVSESGNVLYMNPAAEVIFGEDRKEIVGRGVAVPESTDAPIDISLRTPEGTNGIGEMRIVRTEWEGEKAILISVRDVTARNRAELEIQALNEQLEARVQKRTAQLEAVNRELDAFNYAVAHDLRAPLARIDGYATLLRSELDGKIEPEHTGYLDRIRAAVVNMVELTDGLLQLSRLTGRKMDIQEVDLGAAAAAIVENLRLREPERDVAVTIAPNLKARGDLVLLRAVLENLLANAWKFTKKREGAEIEIGATSRDGKPVFFVRDNGAGFDMAGADKMFTAFHRLHDDAEFPGTGIGLTTVQRIVHRHGGRVWAEAEVDRGAAFYFTLG